MLPKDCCGLDDRSTRNKYEESNTSGSRFDPAHHVSTFSPLATALARPSPCGTLVRMDSAHDRWRWLGRPFFLLALILLALNDHLLKYRYPGWWTGKLSDVSGIVVAGTVASVILGRRRGLVAVGVAFTALKVVPGVAGAAVPVLGGFTVPDPTDLIALVVLFPLAVWLRRIEATPRMASPPVDGEHRWRSVRPVVAAAVPVFAALATILTTTATSCASRPAVIEIDVRGSTFYALVVTSSAHAQWSQSTDRGETWQKSPPPPGRTTRASDSDPFFAGLPNGPQQNCTTDGTCFRLIDQRVIEHRKPNGTWTVDWRLTTNQLEGSSTGCASGSRGVLTSIGANGSDENVHAVASLGASGVLARSAPGAWQVYPVRSARSPTYSGIPEQSLLWGFAVMVLVGIGLAIYGRRRWPSLRLGLLVFAVGTLVIGSSVLGLLLMVLDADGHQLGLPRPAAAAMVLVWVATLLTSINVARRPKPDPPLWLLPPPPPSSPRSADTV